MTDVAVLLENTDRSGECWTWKGRSDRGYARLKGQLVGHMVWEAEHGPIPDGLLILHHCDNPPCIRPSHLFVGTQADNMADMRAKGRGFLPVRERQEVCKRGHAMTPDNIIVAKAPRHGRECRACKTLRNLSRVRS